MNACVLAIWAALGQGAQAADDALKAARAATAYVKVEGDVDVMGEKRRMSWSGTAFLVAARDGTGWLVTNHHVVEGAARVTVVFASGGADERSADAEIAGFHREHDLAIVRVKLKALPAPIALADAEARELQPIHVLGYPFGRWLEMSGGNPTMTVLKAAVSRLRLDGRGRTAEIQIDGDVNPGHSGAPVVDEQGRVIGVACAKVGGTRIAFAVPAKRLAEFIRGSVESVKIAKGENGAFTVAATLRDPLGRVKSAALRLDGREEDVELAIEDGRATGTVRPGDGAHTYRVRLSREDGSSELTEPAKLEPEDDWLGGAPDPAQKRDTPPLEGRADAPARVDPVASGEALAGEKKDAGGAAVTLLKLDGEKVVDAVLWSHDGAHAYLLETGGMVRKIAIPELKEERRLEIGRACSGMARSAEGLVVAVSDRREVWVLDAGTLERKRHVEVGDVSRVASAPGLSIAFATAERDEMAVVDLKKGEVTRKLNARAIWFEQGPKAKRHPTGRWLAEFKGVVVSPDGQRLFCVGDEDMCLHRFRIEGASLVYEEMGAAVSCVPCRIEISPDSKYVGRRCSTFREAEGHAPMDRRGMHIYKADDLHAPAVTFSSESDMQALGYDKAAGAFYAGEYDWQLVVYSPKGERGKAYRVTEEHDYARQILVHPQGRRALVLTDKRVAWVELPK